jgi:hypothetical protein
MRILEVAFLCVMLALIIHQVQADRHIRGFSNPTSEDVNGTPPANKGNAKNKLRVEPCATLVAVRPVLLPRITHFKEAKSPSDFLERRSLKSKRSRSGSRSSGSSSKSRIKFGKLRGASAVGVIVGLLVFFAALALILFIWCYSPKKQKEAKQRKAKDSEAQLVDADDGGMVSMDQVSPTQSVKV